MSVKGGAYFEDCNVCNEKRFKVKWSHPKERRKKRLSLFYKCDTDESKKKKKKEIRIKRVTYLQWALQIST